MKIKKILTLCVLGLMTGGAPLSAQWQRVPTPNDTLQSVRRTANQGVALSIYAPEAKKVTIGGDIFPRQEAVRSESGVWTAVVPNVKDGLYRYHFVVDGVKVYDPIGETASETSAIMRLESTGDEFFAIKNVPHGAIAQRYYFSKSLNETRRMHIWTPPGYEKSAKSLPVLYLIHGGGDTDNAWPTIGAAGFILDNLLAEGKIEPMIVVMPNGTIHTSSLEGEVPLFAKDLMNDIIPFIESNYRVIADKDHRALAGLSMGGLETLEAGLNNFRSFGYLWVLSSGWFADNKAVYEERGAYLKQIAEEFNKSVKVLAFTQGGPEDIAYDNCKAMLKLFDAAGIRYEYSEMPGGHSWYVWRHDLYNLAPRLFK